MQRRKSRHHVNAASAALLAESDAEFARQIEEMDAKPNTLTPERIERIMALAHEWAIQAYRKGCDKPQDIDAARAALLAELEGRK